MKRTYVKALAFLLAVIMVLGVAPLGVFAEGITALVDTLTAEDPIIVIAGSDLQNASGHEAGIATVNAILNKIGVSDAYGFLFAGDYDYYYSDSANGKAALSNAITTRYGADVNAVWVQGNHDDDSLVEDGTLSASGAHDTEHYGVYVINEKDYMWYNDDEATIKATATALDEYLDAKVAEDYDKPIFVVSHLPLHYSMRTRYGGKDGMHANYIFDVLNEAGANGQEIIFLFGHNHSHGWDDYLGGAAIYLQKGDSINIAQNSTTEYKVETLEFTYMNAGYVGYYNTNDSASSVDSTLTLTLFEITDNKVSISRYDANGQHVLKAAGVKRTGAHCYSSGSYTDPTVANTTEYTSPQSIVTNNVVTDPTDTVTVSVPAITGVTLDSKTEKTVEGYSKYVVYDITVDGYTQGDVATVTIKLDSGFVSGIPVTVIDLTTGIQTTKSIENGTVTFTTDHFSEYVVAQVDMSEPVTDTVILPAGTNGSAKSDEATVTAEIALGSPKSGQTTITEWMFTPVTTLSSGEYYVIVSKQSGYVLTTTSSQNKIQLNTLGDYSHVWYYRTSGNNRYLRVSSNGHYLSLSNRNGASLSSSAQKLTLSYVSSQGAWTIKQSSGRTTYYLTQSSTTSTGAGVTTSASSAGNYWYIGKATEGKSQTVVFTVDPGSITMPTDRSYTIQPTVTVDGVATTNYTINWSSSRERSVDVDNNGKITHGGWGNNATITAKLTHVNGVELADPITIEIPVTIQSSTSTTYSLSVNPGSLYLNTDGSYALTPTVRANNSTTTNYTILWTSSDEAVATVDANGKVQATGEGEATITATLVTANGTTLEDQPTVSIPVDVTDIPVTLSVAPGTVSMNLDSSYSLIPTVLYDGVATDEYTIDWTSSDSSIVSVDENGNLTSYSEEGTVTITATMTSVNGETMSKQPQVKITVKSSAKQVVSVTIDRQSAIVNYGSKVTQKTGAYLIVTYDDGSIGKIPVTISMLEGEYNLRQTGTYENLTVKYGDLVVTDSFALTVTAIDYPNYPNEGAVRVNKTATGIDFQASGLAQVELSATGVPVKKGADVIVMLDMSSSMKDTVDNVTRLEVLKEALQKLITQFQGTDAMGDPYDIRLAVADFNSYYSNANSPYYIDKNDHLINGSIRTSTGDANKVFTGNGQLNAGAFVDVGQLDNAGQSIIDQLATQGGTNYDYAFDAIYQLGSAIRTANEEAGEERELYVVFMSDGAPFQYNYFSAQSGTEGAVTDARYWNNWLQGTITDDMLYSGAHNNFYNEDGKHWMAEAIKGDTDTDYPVIRKDVSKDSFTTVKGLGATMYSVGFCLAVDKEITVESMERVLSNIASSSTTYWKADTAEDLNNAFTNIGSEIAYAATEARFVDTMGTQFDLQLGDHKYKVVENDREVEKTISPEIVVRAYDIYTREDVNAGTVDESKIGVRTGTSSKLETVTFNAAGTEAYSDKLSGNILIGGVICAQTFFYNTSETTAVMIDTDGDGKTDFSLAPETFYWNLGTVNTKELALSYYVYLTGSLEGTREAGSYPTNESAILHYKNWVGNECQVATVSPVMPWKEANVSYGFYLVNENGQPINAAQEVVPFANRVIVVPATLYDKVLLNNTEQISALSVTAGNILPSGCELYDVNASYSVAIHSAGGGSWEITKGDGLNSTTYVTGFSGDTFSNELSEDSVGYDYTHTIVWFAVKFGAKTADDAIVIDYGTPVDVDVLSNDIFYNAGTLEGISLTKGEFGSTAETIEGVFGKVEIVNGKIRYTPNTLTITEPEVIYYAVYFQSDEEFSGYYYGQLTVIPATIMYFEDNFVEYTNASNVDKDATDIMGAWTKVGTDEINIQAEDRVGIANNVYGYDPMNSNYTTYSNGGAMKVTVNANTYAPDGNYKSSPHATFTFTGTAFDIISLTDSTTDMIGIDVSKDGVDIVNTMVDNYYGYIYDEATDSWTVDPEADGGVWQVPVMKIDMEDYVAEGESAYGTYTVNIYVLYNKYFDHDGKEESTFILDAIRIYNPVKQGNTVAEDAYKADGEYNPTFTVLKEIILSADNVIDENTIDGIVFIDGKDATSDYTDYANPGPNNETYLAHEQAVSFKLTADVVPATVQIGVKLAFGSSATLFMNEKEFVKVTTATDMYYVMLTEEDWTLVDGKYTTGTITLTNVSEDGVISLTNLKYTQNSDVTPEVVAIVDDEVVEEAGAVMFALFRAPAIEETEPETEAPTEPETEAPTEPETFEPEFVETVVIVTPDRQNGKNDEHDRVDFGREDNDRHGQRNNRGNGKNSRNENVRGKTNKPAVVEPVVSYTAHVVVTTSRDVASVTVNGQVVTEYVEIPVFAYENGQMNVNYLRVWGANIAVESTETEVAITVYNANGVAYEVQ